MAKLNFQEARARVDKVAWGTIRAQVPPPLDRHAPHYRPRDYAELGEHIAARDFELAWSDFLHEFFRYRTADFFAVPPPTNISVGWQALLAGAAEWLSVEFLLPVPAWTERTQYFLPEIWDPWEDLLADMAETRPKRIERSAQAFLRRNVVFESRNLISI